MSSEPMDDVDVLLQMAREFPIRTALFTIALPLFSLFTVINGVLHGGVILYIGGFAAIVAAYSVMLTRYQIAAYRRRRLVHQPTRSE